MKKTLTTVSVLSPVLHGDYVQVLHGFFADSFLYTIGQRRP